MPSQSAMGPADAKSGRREQSIIRVTLSPEEQEEFWELGRDIRRLGGVATELGYAFPTASWRDEAAECLADTWGTGCFRSLNLAGRDASADGRPDSRRQRLIVAGCGAGQADDIGGLLSIQGFDVLQTAGAVECLELLRDGGIDVLVLDENLFWGGSDGLLARLREDLQELAVPVILLVSERPADQQPPVVQCVVKPSQSDELLELLHAELSRLEARADR